VLTLCARRGIAAFAAPRDGMRPQRRPVVYRVWYWFTSSTSFANPTVTVGRRFSDTFAGIAPSSVPPFIAMQLLGAVIGTSIVLTLYPDAGQRADDVVIPHTNAHQPTVKASS
jgi:glycerol uptake facilitator-like aquaporin